MRAVHREQGEDEVVRDQGRDLSGSAGHSRFGGGAGARPWLLFAAGEAVFLSITLLPDARRRLAAYLFLCLAGCLLSVFAARSLSASGPRFLLFCAAVFRLTLLFRPPDLSEDVWRYLWDGHVAASGRSPYAFAPGDPRAAGIAPEVRSRLSYRDVRTVYPPVAQAVFRGAATLPGSGVTWIKSFVAAADVAIVPLLLASGGSGARFGAALYAFHPLAVTESAGQGHLDSLGVALMLAAIVYVGRRRPFAAGVSLAASILTKYVSAAATLPLLRRGKLSLAVAALVSGAALWALASSGGASPAGGFSDYATRWEFNSLFYPAAAGLVEAADLPERAKTAYIRWKERLDHPRWTQALFPFFYTAFFARALLAMLLAAALGVIAARVRDLESAVFASLGALLLFSPTLHPWYLLWVLPLAAKRREPAFLYLSFVVPLAYALLYPIPGWTRGTVLAVEYAPFAALLGVTLWKDRAQYPGSSTALTPALSRREGEQS